MKEKEKINSSSEKKKAEGLEKKRRYAPKTIRV